MPQAVSTDQCVCGGPCRALCPACGRYVKVVGGKFAPHETGVCTGSHMEYKSCTKSGKLVGLVLPGDGGAYG